MGGLFNSGKREEGGLLETERGIIREGGLIREGGHIRVGGLIKNSRVKTPGY